MNELFAEINEQPWAILPSAIDKLCAQVKQYTQTGQPPAAARESETVMSGAVAVVPVSGPLMSKDSFLARVFGLASSDRLSRTVTALAADPSVGVIVLDMDCPGGTVSGVQECAAAIAAVRGRKKVVAISNHMMASAAYWLGSSADEVIASPSSLTGSIGVISTHFNMAGALEQAGVEVSILTAGKYKGEGNQYQPLDDEARSAMQALIDGFYNDFTQGVAKNRDVSVSDVKNGFGQGRVLMAKDAKAAGLVDRIESFDELIARLSTSKRAQTPNRRMAADLSLIEAIHYGEQLS